MWLLRSSVSFLGRRDESPLLCFVLIACDAELNCTPRLARQLRLASSSLRLAFCLSVCLSSAHEMIHKTEAAVAVAAAAAAGRSTAPAKRSKRTAFTAAFFCFYLSRDQPRSARQLHLMGANGSQVGSQIKNSTDLTFLSLLPNLKSQLKFLKF